MTCDRLKTFDIKECSWKIVNREFKDCANCPFENEIIQKYPEFKTPFAYKKRLVEIMESSEKRGHKSK